jgi:hypothetical protein
LIITSDRNGRELEVNLTTPITEKLGVRRGCTKEHANHKAEELADDGREPLPGYRSRRLFTE